MTEFVKKSLNHHGLGFRLKEVRELKQLSPKLVAQKLNINLQYLLDIENDRFDRLPAGLYSKNYIREYAKLLGFPPAEIKKWLKQNLEQINENSDPFSQKVLSRKQFIAFPRLTKNILLSLLFLACLLYLGLYFKKIVFPPKLEIYQPDRNLKISENSIEIKGKTEAEAEVQINGETVLNNNNGYFSTNINLKKGVNNILIKAQKKYSSENTVLRQILVE
jgi:cytoskeletal protein RodZ